MAFKKSESAGFVVNHLARLFAKRLQARIAPLGILIGQFPILLELWERDGVTQKELLSELDLEQATLANTLTRMERDGLIRREPNPADARSQKICLTDKARSARDAAYQAAHDQNAQALAGLSPDERKQFLALCGRIVRALRD